MNHGNTQKNRSRSEGRVDDKSQKRIQQEESIILQQYEQRQGQSGVVERDLPGPGLPAIRCGPGRFYLRAGRLLLNTRKAKRDHKSNRGQLGPFARGRDLSRRK